MGGGDLLNLLIERDVFPEDFTRFYVAEVSSHRVSHTSSSPCEFLRNFHSTDGTCYRVLP